MSGDITVTCDTRQARRELNRLRRAPADTDLIRFDKILIGIFQETQAFVHIRTGSLQRSGKVNAYHHRGTWGGEIRYGGSAPGARHDPVDYARAEQLHAQGHHTSFGQPAASHYTSLGRSNATQRRYGAATRIRDAAGSFTAHVRTSHDFMLPAYNPDHDLAFLNAVERALGGTA